MNNTEMFTHKADLYSKYRQGYSNKLIQYIYSNIDIGSNSYVADIGSGTGMFSELLLKQDSMVFAVEPNDSMRSIAELNLSKYYNFHSIKAAGENTLLPQNSIDFITVVQAFHWLDTESFKVECKRILKKGGKVIVIYNRKKKESEVNLKLAELIKKYYPNHKDIINHWEQREYSIKKFFDNVFEFIEFENNIVNNLQEFIGRTLSHSFFQNDEGFIAGLKEIFSVFSKNNNIVVPNDTIAYIGTV